MDADNVGAPVTKQQWDYIHKMGDALRQSFDNVSAVFAPSCISHSALTKRDWTRIKIDDVSVAEALHCWERKIARRMLRKMKRVGQIKTKIQHRLTEAGARKNNKRKKRKICKKGKKCNIPNRRRQRSVLSQRRRGQSRFCSHRKLERCSWPQCNHSCPKLHNPFTGEEMDFIELLKSFGLDMESVAKALGIDIHTLNTMDHVELLNLLTQQVKR